MNSKTLSTHKVAIITVTYNSANFIEQYLESVALYLQNSDHQLFLVDNQSSDNTVDIAQQFAQTHQLTAQIHVIPSNDNLGFGKGCNLGVEHAKPHQPTHLWFLNPDTIIFEDTGPALIQLLEENPKIDFTGSTLVDKNNVPRPGAYRFPTALNVFLSMITLGILDKLFHKHTTAIPVENQAVEADWLTGASFLVKYDCFESLEGFDPQYFLYFEEVDLFFRAKKKGFMVSSCPNSRVFHISGASTGINNKDTEIKRRPSYWFESRRHYYIKNYGKAYFLLVDLSFFLGFFLKRLRSFIQQKDAKLPQYFARDTLKHSLIGRFNN